MSDVLIRQTGHLGHVTLNRPKAINALTHGMVRDIHSALLTWKDDPSVTAILIDGEGERGFCAGGDIAAIYQSARSHDGTAAQFWREEYPLNALISRYPKPYVALMHGIVMGGGVGLSAHGSFRIVTGTSRIAMPEVGIGFVPDVGGLHLLSRAPGELGAYLGLTGAPMKAVDAILCGFADCCVNAEFLPQVIQNIAECHRAEDVAAAIRSVASAPPPGELADKRAWIDACFRHESIEDILAALDAHSNADAHATAAIIRKQSPTSLKVTLRGLRSARSQSLAECLKMEFRMAVATTLHHDLAEGIRAAVIDKDRQPKWRPATLDDVSPALVASHFSAPAGGDLDLPE